ncbi:hypothetical protein ONS95_002289 [Cadophora gregata]|uniref:uncharacterized protein n=1 Tax=Cadophora gregata TaxID=51156 RepID=UPI0026DD3E51|nr:uncharacterized protein ONS95_002289 [Cadophora gregata]KAK0109605.1 hypothetical protein ONS95_002289 [Cadophora gregata]KAK0110764.1 hypothetical protein ONS96_002361 [Cadophora gregata f. sp. sojae]
MSTSPQFEDKTMDSHISEDGQAGSVKIPASIPSKLTPGVAILSDEAHRAVCRAIGAPPSRYEEPKKDSTLRIDKRIPDGLYKATIKRRRKAQFSYYFTATLYNTCLVLQILLGAALTALGSASKKNGTAITILAAANTVNAGLVALLHNSGLPGRIRNDWNEYDKVEMFLVEMMDSRIAEDGLSTADVIQTCFNKYSNARATVERNKPNYYSGAPATAPGTAAGATPPVLGAR